MDKVVHFEITFDDHERAKEFYGSVFDWELSDNDMGNGVMYTTATTVPIDDKMHAEGARRDQRRVHGRGQGDALARDHDRRRLDRRHDEEDRGRRRYHVTPRTPIPSMGAFAYFKDSEGNTMGLWETSM